MRKFKTITYTMRLKIEALYNNGFQKTKIANEIGTTYTSVYREIKRGLYEHRNTDYTTSTMYSAEIAQRDHDTKMSKCGRPIKLGND